MALGTFGAHDLLAHVALSRLNWLGLCLSLLGESLRTLCLWCLGKGTLGTYGHHQRHVLNLKATRATCNICNADSLGLREWESALYSTPCGTTSGYRCVAICCAAVSISGKNLLLLGCKFDLRSITLTNNSAVAKLVYDCVLDAGVSLSRR